MSFFLHNINPEPLAGNAVVALQDRGFLLGDGVFDTMIAVEGHLVDGPAHAARLARAGAAIGIAIEEAAILSAMTSVAEAAGGRDAILRTTLTRGAAARGLWPASAPTPTLAATAQPWQRSLIGDPARLSIAKIPRNQRSPLSKLKSLAYLENILAARQASEEGCEDALLLNLDGRAACSTIANVFLIQGENLVTPPQSDGCLDGIMRHRVLESASGLGLKPIEAPVTIDDLLAADAVFLTNSVRLLRPVVAIDGKALSRSSLTGELLDFLLATFGRDSGVAIGRQEISPAFARTLP